MRCRFFNSKVLQMAFLFLLLLCVSSFAGTFPREETSLAQDIQSDRYLTDPFFDKAQLSIDSLTPEAGKYELYAMSGRKNENQSGSAERPKNGPMLKNWHRYLGYGTILMAGLTAVTSSNESLHESLAYTTAAGSLSSLTTGYLAHSNRFYTDQDLLSKNNLHIALGTLGAAVLTTAVVIADDGEESSHSGLGVAGGVLMTLGVIEIKW